MSQTYLPVLASALLLSAACAGGDGDEAEEVQPEAVVGHYEVTSTYNAAGALPDVATDTLGILDGLADDPAGTLIDLAEQAGAPIDWEEAEDITVLSEEELRELLRALTEEEALSYMRRILQGRIDLIRAELVGRGVAALAPEDLARVLLGDSPEDRG